MHTTSTAYAIHISKQSNKRTDNKIDNKKSNLSNAVAKCCAVAECCAELLLKTEIGWLDFEGWLPKERLNEVLPLKKLNKKIIKKTKSERPKEETRK